MEFQTISEMALNILCMLYCVFMETFLAITTTKSILMNSEKHWNGLHPVVSNTQPKSTNSLYTIHPYH